jgi:hypothetical protein
VRPHHRRCSSDSDQVTFALSLRYDLLRGVSRDASNRRQKLPLIWIRIEGLWRLREVTRLCFPKLTQPVVAIVGKPETYFSGK